MCLIAYAPNKTLISLESLENAYKNNKDGWGICYQDLEQKELIINKQLLDFNEFKKAWEKVPEGVHVGVHFRWKTHGDINRENVHPYLILDKAKGDPADLALMHNGVISYIYKAGESRSDTQMYVDLILRPILLENWKLIYNSSFQFIIQRDIGTGSKFLLLPSEGDPIIYNKEQGHEPKTQPDVWYSNSYSIATSTWRANKNAPTTTTAYSNPAPWRSRQFEFNGFDHRRSYGYNRDANDGIEAFVWPTDLTTEEEATKAKILNLVPKDHRLLASVSKNNKIILGLGWTQDTRYASAQAVYHQNIATKLRKFLKDRQTNNTTTKDKETASNVVSIDKETVDRLTRANLGLFSQAEVLEWVVNNPDDACEYLISAGFSGGRRTVLEWINTNLDKAVDQIYNHSHFGKLLDVQNQSTPIVDEETMFDNYYYA